MLYTMSVHTLIRNGRLRLKMSEQQFADAVGVSRGAVQQWEKPNGTAPKRATQPRVAALLGISTAELMTGVVVEGLDVRIEVPLISLSEAARFAAGALKRVPHVDTVFTTVEVRSHTFAVKVEGDMMVSESNDSFPPGSVLIVEPDMEPSAGDYVIAKDPAGDTTFKQLIRDGGEFYLKPLNPRYPIRALGTSEIVGVVREFTKRFR